MIAFNAASQVAALGSVLVIQTVYMFIVLRVLGPEDFGRFAFAWSIIQILMIGGDIGLHNTALRKIASAPDQSEQISSLFFYLKTVLTGLLVLVVVVIALLNQAPATRLILLIFGAGMFFHSMSTGINVVFQAHGKLYLGSLNVLLVFLIQFLAGVAFILAGGRLVSLSVAYVIGTVCAFILNLTVLRRSLHSFRIRHSEGWKEFVLQSVPVGLGTFFHTVTTRIGISLLYFFTGAYQTGLYSAAVRFPQALYNVPGGIFGAILPAMAAHQKDREPVRYLFYRSLALMILISIPISLILFLAAEPLILLICGEDYTESVRILEIVAWTLIPVFIGMTFSHVILSQERLVGRLPYVTGAALVVNLTACWLLIPRFESIGASWALVLTELVLAVGYILASLGFLKRRKRN